MARVLFTSGPLYGHMLPMLPLLRAAERAGHDVRVATGPDLHQQVAARGIRTTPPIGRTFAEAWAANEAVWADTSIPVDQKMVPSVAAVFGEPAVARFTDLVAISQEWRPEVVVHEVLELGGSLLARHLDVPGVVHAIGPMFPFYGEIFGPVGVAIGEPGLWEQASSEQALDICPPSLQPVDGPHPWPRASALRPSAGEPGEVPPHVAEVLVGDRPVAYFTLGTVKNTDTADFTAGLTAMEEYDGVVIATTGRPLGPDELGPVPANVVVADFVPQANVLERADLLVSHSGSGTMLGGLEFGVPQVALPRGTDQPQNAALLAQAGAGVVVAPEDFAVDTIRAAVRDVAGDPSYRAAAERVRDEIAAMPDADTVWAAIAF